MLLTEQIMQTVQSLLTNNVDADVFRGRTDPLSFEDLPAIAIFQGAETPADEDGRTNMRFMDQLLEIRTAVAAASTHENIETDLNELRRQVHVLMMTDNALNLPYVIDIIPNGVDEPDIDATTERVTGTMVINWVVYYRHQQQDAGLAP